MTDETRRLIRAVAMSSGAGTMAFVGGLQAIVQAGGSLTLVVWLFVVGTGLGTALTTFGGFLSEPPTKGS